MLLGAYKVNIFGMNFADSAHILGETFVLFMIILVVTAVINIFRTHLLAVINNVSVWWHVLGVAVIIAILIFVPDQHQSFSFVFSQRINNTGFIGGATSGLFFWLYILPIGFLLTQYTITGFDASAHISEETHGASRRARARRLAVDLLLGGHRLDPAARDHLRGDRTSSFDHQRGNCWLRRRLVAGGLQLRLADLGGIQGRRADLDGRPAVLWPGLPDQRLAHVLSRSPATARCRGHRHFSKVTRTASPSTP